MVSAIIALFAVALAGCDRGESKTAAATATPPQVTVAKPTVKTITEWDEYTGRFTAVESVDVRSRVSGYLTEIHFKDGQLISKGDLLFTIDRRPFEMAVASAEAEIKVADAALAFARQELARAGALRKTNVVSERVFDERESAVHQSEARLAAARTALDRAKLDLEFSEVRAPVAGRIDSHAVSVGNLISGGDTGATLLTNIVSLDPIHVTFDVDQAAFLKYTRAARDGTRPSSREVANPVRVALPGDKGFPLTGKMDFVSNQIDRASATIRARAIIDNKDLALAPGLFAKVQLIGSGAREAVMIPEEAIATDQASRVAYVVNNGKVELRTVSLGPIVDGLRVVRDGVRPDDLVVISGLQRIRAGQEVTVRTEQARQFVSSAATESKEIER